MFNMLLFCLQLATTVDVCEYKTRSLCVCVSLQLRQHQNNNQLPVDSVNSDYQPLPSKILLILKYN